MQTPLGVGHAFLVSGSQTGIRSLARDPDFIVLTDQSAVEDLSRAPLAIAALFVMAALAAALSTNAVAAVIPAHLQGHTRLMRDRCRLRHWPLA